MTHFVVDNTEIPSPRVNERPITNVATQLDAAEYNALWQSVADVRSTIKGFIAAEAFGIVGDGIGDKAPAIRSALSTCASLGAILRCPKGDYPVSQDGSNPWRISVPGGCGLEGVPGEGTRFLAIANATGSPIDTLHLNGVSNVLVRDIVVDGIWDAGSATVADASAGLSLPQSTIYVDDVADLTEFQNSGTYKIVVGAGNLQTITYTGVTRTLAGAAFTGCTGGAGVLKAGMRIGTRDDSNGGPHTTQADPRDMGVRARGCKNIVFERVSVKRQYGDAFWFGYRGDPIEDVNTACRNITMINCRVKLCARNGISIGQSVAGLKLLFNDVRDVFATALDMEPQTNNQFARDVLAIGNHFDTWWNPGNPSRTLCQTVSITGGNVIGLLDANAARNIRFVGGNHIVGSVGISGARSVLLDGNYHVIDFDHGASGGVSNACVFMDHTIDDVTVINSDFYDRGKFVDAYAPSTNPHAAVIVVQSYGLLQPAGVTVEHNRIRARASLVGIQASGVGGGAKAGGGYRPSSVQFTATSVTSSTVTLTGAGWTVDEFVGYNVLMGGLQAVVVSNTATVLTLAVRIPSGGAWNLPFGIGGSAAPTPAAGTCIMSVPTGVLSISHNTIDCTNDGNGAGSHCVTYYGEQSGGRVKIDGNTFRNANGRGAYIDCTTATRTLRMQVTNNLAIDDQATPTCLSTVHFKNGTAGIDQLVIYGNGKSGGVRKEVTGISSGYWVEMEADAPIFGGYGSPASVVRAPAASLFRSRDGGGGFYLWVKQGSGDAFDATPVKNDSTGISVASGAALNYIPSITTVTDGCLIVAALAAQPGSGTGDFDNYANGGLVGITEIDNFTIAGCLGVITAKQVTHGATGAITARNNGAATVFGPCAITMALQPETAGITPTYIGKGTRQTRTTSGSMTVAWPTSAQTIDGADVQEGDYALMIAEFLETETLSLTVPAGFTEITNSPALGTYSGTGGSRIRIWEARALVSPPATSPQITYTAVGSPAHVQVTIFAFRGCALASTTGWTGK